MVNYKAGQTTKACCLLTDFLLVKCHVNVHCIKIKMCAHWFVQTLSHVPGILQVAFGSPFSPLVQSQHLLVAHWSPV